MTRPTRRVEFVLPTPTTILIAGPTGSGKTEMVSRMLRDSSGYFSEDIHEIRYHYGAWQERFASMRQEDPRYVFVPEVPTMADLPDGSKHTVIVIDDLMEEVSKSTTTTDIFTKYSHHRNITVIFIVQKLYGDSRNARVISGNAHIIVLFKNPRDSRAITVLGSQMFPGKKGFLTSAFADATKEPYSYLVVNAHQSTKDELRVIGNLFDAESPTVYTAK